MRLSEADTTRLRKVVALFGSPEDGEVLAAVRAACGIAQRNNMTIGQMLLPDDVTQPPAPPPAPRQRPPRQTYSDPVRVNNGDEWNFHVTRFIRPTEKAVLVELHLGEGELRECWLPLSQVLILSHNVIVPDWLAKANHLVD